jgi:hypothetical protein
MLDEQEYDLERGLSRRAVLGLGVAAVPAFRLLRAATARTAAPPIVKPLPADLFTVFGSNAEMKWAAMQSQWYTTPNDRFFVRNHTSTPSIDPATYATVVQSGVDVGHVRRPLPVAKAVGDALLAYEMNGQTLPADRGFPVRPVVPGWVGISNIKWVGQIEVSKDPLYSFWNTQQYRMIGGDYPADSPPLTTQVVKSAFEFAQGASLPAHRRTTLTGRSWSGASAIKRVDVSIDHGASWLPAKLQKRGGAGVWTQWSFDFPSQPAGTYQLWARAADASCRVQPDVVPANSLGYLFGGIVRHPVVVD